MGSNHPFLHLLLLLGLGAASWCLFASTVAVEARHNLLTRWDPSMDMEERCGVLKTILNPLTGRDETCPDNNPEACKCRGGQCCSRWNLCGMTKFHCSEAWGCNPKFGRCGLPGNSGVVSPEPDAGRVEVITVAPPCLECQPDPFPDNNSDDGKGVAVDEFKPALDKVEPPPDAVDDGPPPVCPSDNAKCKGAPSTATPRDAGCRGIGCSPLPDPNKHPLTAAVEAAEQDPFLRVPQKVQFTIVNNPPLTGLEPRAPSAGFTFVPSPPDRYSELLGPRIR